MKKKNYIYKRVFFFNTKKSDRKKRETERERKRGKKKKKNLKSPTWGGKPRRSLTDF